MNKFLKSIFAAFCVSAIALSVGCGGEGTTDNPPDKPNPPAKEVNISTENVEKDYVYLTYGQNDRHQKLRFQAPDYMLQITSDEGSITGFQPVSYSEKHFVEQDFDKVAESNTQFYVRTDKGLSQATGVQAVQNSRAQSSGRYWRLLEGGKYKQKADVPKLVYDKEENLYGRLEVVAYQMNFRLQYDLFSSQRVNNAILSFDFTSEEYTAFGTALGGRAVTLQNAQKDGVAFILPTDGSVVAEEIENGVKFTADAITVTPKKLAGFGVNAVPFLGGDLSGAEEVIARESIAASVVRTSPENETPTTKYEETTGTLLIDGNHKSGINWQAYNDNSDFNAYDVYNIKLKNDGDTAVTYPVSVMMNNTLLNSAENLFGTSCPTNLIGNASFLRDKNGFPVGIPVQTSKNWHTYASNDVEAVACTFTGQWYVGTVYIEVPAKSEAEYEFVTVYAKWGEVESANHSQLSLVGWDGYDLWEQLSLGSYGETICYYVNGNATGSWIADIRPFRVTEYHGNNVKYSWSGNVGGAEFLRYDDQYERPRFVDNVRSDFRAQGPNMTETDTLGYTSDGKIYTSITSNLVRTDDVTRNFFTIEYTFLEDVEFTRMTLFQYNTNRYQQDFFRKYAYGNGAGVIKDAAQDGKLKEEFCDGATAQQTDVEGENPWFYLYDFDFSQRGETSGAGYIVREYNAELNGKTYASPTVNFRNCKGQLSFELTTPKEVGRNISKGSKISMVVEFVVLPNKTESFYGESEYMNETLNLFGTAQQALQQAAGGNVAVSASVGKVLSRYPVTVACDSSASGTVAEFTIKGGLGYVPVKLTGLNSYNGYKLQVKEGETWKDIDQSVKGNDFWQCGKDAVSGKYYLVYNVKNTVGVSTFNTENRYRLIER